jgi:hypothetical protein
MHMRNFRHFLVGDKSKRTYNTNLAYEGRLDTSAIISPSGRTQKLAMYCLHICTGTSVDSTQSDPN